MPPRPRAPASTAAEPASLGDVGHVLVLSVQEPRRCFGDGGAITTDDDEVAELARALRFHGSRDKRTFDYVGYNSRLDELQAAILRVLLPELDGWCDGRRAAARAYAEAGIEQYVSRPACPPAPSRHGICTWPPIHAPTS